MDKHAIIQFVFLAGLLGSTLSGQETVGGTRTIRLLQDDGQLRMASRLYELKHVKATDVRPFIEAAVKRYNSSSKVERVNYSAAKRQLFIVTTGEDFLPYVDDLVAGLDQPGKADANGSIIDGTGVTRITYVPKYRSADDIQRIVNNVLKTAEGAVFLNKDTNTIYWKDDKIAANAALAWVKYLDRPLPQVNLRLNYYEIRESDLRDVGLDYLAWKNGAGLHLLSVGYDGGRVFSEEAAVQLGRLADLTRNFTTSWGYGAFLFSPQFDLSFIRLLQQNGHATLAAHADLTFVNTPVYDDASLNAALPKTYTATLTPGYANIAKTKDGASSVTSGGHSTLTLTVRNPVICFGASADEVGPKGELPTTEEFYARNRGGVVFAYELHSKSVVERDNLGDELGKSSDIGGELTLGFQTEKLLASHVKEQEVKQETGVPVLGSLPVLKYLFGSTTSHKERTYIIVTAEASLVHPDATVPPRPAEETSIGL